MGRRPISIEPGPWFRTLGRKITRGRYVSPEETAIERHWHIGRQNQMPLFTTNFNVALIMQVPIILQSHGGALELIADSRQDFEDYRVDTKVNGVRDNYPELLEKTEEK